MRLLSDAEARGMRCAEFSSPIECAGKDCHSFQFLTARNMATGEDVTGTEIHNPNVMRLGVCTKAALRAESCAVILTETA